MSLGVPTFGLLCEKQCAPALVLASRQPETKQKPTKKGQSAAAYLRKYMCVPINITHNTPSIWPFRGIVKLSALNGTNDPENTVGWDILSLLFPYDVGRQVVPSSCFSILGRLLPAGLLKSEPEPGPGGTLLIRLLLAMTMLL